MNIGSPDYNKLRGSSQKPPLSGGRFGGSPAKSGRKGKSSSRQKREGTTSRERRINMQEMNRLQGVYGENYKLGSNEHPGVSR